MSRKISEINLREGVDTPIALYIGMSSFESRCLSILSSIKSEPKSFLLFKNLPESGSAEINFQKMGKIAKNHTRIDLDPANPIEMADKFHSYLAKFDQTLEGAILFDITTFTHEQLLIFLRILSAFKINREVIFGYTRVDQYSTNTDRNRVWLSDGVTQIRSVLGFPGELVPSKKLHLIALIGFEVERAKAIIERFEPSMLTLGVGGVSQSVTAAHYETNQKFFDEIRKFVDTRISIDAQVNQFEISGVNPFFTRDAILAEVRRHQNYNTVVAPLNNKISTLGAGLAAICSQDIQLCYSRVARYNEDGYSSPSQEALFMEINFSTDDVCAL